MELMKRRTLTYVHEKGQGKTGISILDLGKRFLEAFGSWVWQDPDPRHA